MPTLTAEQQSELFSGDPKSYEDPEEALWATIAHYTIEYPTNLKYLGVSTEVAENAMAETRQDWFGRCTVLVSPELMKKSWGYVGSILSHEFVHCSQNFGLNELFNLIPPLGKNLRIAMEAQAYYHEENMKETFRSDRLNTVSMFKYFVETDSL